MKIFEVLGGSLTLADIVHCLKKDIQIKLAKSCYAKIKKSQQTVMDVIHHNQTVYGINTGFGKLANTRIPNDELEQLQKNIVLSHAAGVGPLLDDDIVRLIILLKINSLAQGYSGVSPELIDMLVTLFNHQVYPCVPSKGSVGASGDLAPLAHLTCALIGVGEVRYQAKIISAKKGLAKAGLTPIKLKPKEGLALLNGVQVSNAIALIALIKVKALFNKAIIAGSLTIDAASGSTTPFDDRIHKVRGHFGQRECAKWYKKLLKGSAIRDAHKDCDRVQDPYSLRCQPQVMGACLDQIQFVAKTLIIEANAVSDNPLVFPDQGDIISGGNFHGEPVAMAADNLALAIAEIGALSERRTALLIDANISRLPAFLVKHSGLNSGFMLAQVTAAALASENKSLAHPASVDSLPTSANQEDHVSMSTFAARRLLTMCENTEEILNIELLAACQGIDFHQPLTTSPALQKVLQEVRALVPFYENDRLFSKDLQRIKALELEFVCRIV